MTIADYRENEIDSITDRNVSEWIDQFDKSVRVPILSELNHVLARSYFSKPAVEEAIATMVRSPPEHTDDPASFWRTVNFLWIQDKGDSQRHMRKLFRVALKAQTGLRLSDCGAVGGPYLYLDDCVYTATHVRWDLIKWVKSDEAPRNGRLIVLAVAMHSGRTRYTTTEVSKAALSVGKQYTLADWWHLREIAELEYNGSETEVLKPSVLPADDGHVNSLVKQLQHEGHPFRPRSGRTTSKNKIFSSESARSLLEMEFLKAGARIKYELCTHLPSNAWPLGYDVFKGPGFGSLVLTYRNCANNCPLALWAGEPWIPLFPRRINPSYQNFDPSVLDDESV